MTTQIKDENGNRYISQRLFIWIVGALAGFIVIMGTFFWGQYQELDGRLRSLRGDLFQEVKIVSNDIAEIKADVSIIKSIVLDGKNAAP